MADRLYTAPDIPEDEVERLEEVYGLNLLDTASELRFDRYTSLVADIFNFPIVLITFLDRDRQWFKSSCGLDLLETSRDVSFCGHTINYGGVLVIPDTHKDPRFAGNPLVVGPPYIRFYAGSIVHGPRGKALGTLCVIDRIPRTFSEKQCGQLRQFSDLVENEIRHNYDLDVLRASIQFSACYDPLTKLPNRELMAVCLGKLMELTGKEGGKVAVLSFNLPDLHLLKHSFRGETVERLLIEVAERLQECCPAGGTAAHIEANEFALAFASFNKSTAQIDQVVNDARTALNKPLLPGSDHYLRVRIGGSVFPGDGATPAELIERASSAAWLSTSDGTNDTRFYSKEESLTVSERLKIESNLRGAIEKQHLRLVYQPIVTLNDGALSSVEALLRWNDPELGEISPERFIPIAERAGLIVAIGQWVQQEACRQLTEWRAAGDWNIPVAINVAPVELLQPTYARTLLEQLKSKEIPPSMINIEVTECSLLVDSAQADQNLKLLNKAGVQINIDDFGTGYSSLAYLRRMPIRKLKIDRSFIGGLPQDKQEVTLIQTILGMARALSLDTVAEGVENEQQLDYLRGVDCEFVQGFYISYPLLPANIPELRNRALA